MGLKKVPLIGIAMSPPEGGVPEFNLNPEYADAVVRAGGDPLAFPLVADPGYVERMLKLVDGIVLAGSVSNIDPARYGQGNIGNVNGTDERRDEFDRLVITGARQNGIPILGICHGCQAINVTLGGSLYQNVMEQVPDAIVHRAPSRTGEYAHDVELQPVSVLNVTDQPITIGTNSAHTQAVDQLGRDLIVTGRTADGVIEAIEGTDMAEQFILGLQWHPERLAATDKYSAMAFGALITATSR